MRLFASLSPTRDVREHLGIALGPIRECSGPTLRWPDPDQWHLTCAFYGEIPEGTIPELEARLREVAARHAPPTLHLRGAGTFAGRTLWVGVGGDVAALGALFTDCEAVPTASGHVEERGRKRAHLTVARLSARERGRARRRRGPSGRGPAGRRPGDDGPLADLVRALAVYSGPDWTPPHLELVASEPGAGRSGGARHTVVATMPLGGTGYSPEAGTSPG